MQDYFTNIFRAYQLTFKTLVRNATTLEGDDRYLAEVQRVVSQLQTIYGEIGQMIRMNPPNKDKWRLLRYRVQMCIVLFDLSCDEFDEPESVAEEVKEVKEEEESIAPKAVGVEETTEPKRAIMRGSRPK